MPPQAPQTPDAYQELADVPAKNKPKGLFEELLLGNHLVLYYDMLERPELYDDAAKQLIDTLTAGKVEHAALTPQERASLDTATLEYAMRPATKATEKAKIEILKKAEARLDPMPKEPGTPEADMPEFWWLT